MDKNEKNLSGYGFSFKDYIKILENPNKIGLNNGIWSAPILKGYDKNQRGYGIDINTNKKAKALTNNRPGRWLTEKEADTLMDDHINYITEAANKHIKGFSELPFRRKWALLGMLYRGDSVNKSGININEPDDLKFFKSISDYYRSKGLNARANSSDKFFNRPVSKLLSMFKLKQGGLVRKMLTAAGGPLKIKFDPKRIARLEYLMTRVPGMNNSGGDKYKKEGVLALQHLKLEAKRKELEIRSRLERPYVIKQKASILDKLRGINDEYEQTNQVVGMSGADPIGEFILAGIGLGGIGTLAKTGAWGTARLFPTSYFGNLARLYFVGNAFKNSFNGTVPASLLASKNLVKTESNKQKRVISEGTYPMYKGKLHSVKEVVNPDGTVNPRQAMRILHEVSELFPGSYKMEHRLENPEWHKNDPTTYHHTKNVALSAWGLNVPYGFTKHDLMVAALGHDFGKIVAGDGHAQIGADLAKQVFPDLTEAQYKAIAEHMGTPKTSLGKATKAADMRNGIVVRDINGKTRILLPTHTDTKPREIVMDPQGDNKYYVHMRVWDDVGKHVPGNISNIEKSNLFQTLYETLPDNAEILFPKSGPGNYGTRGTVAGLQRLSRDPRFTSGTKGTLQYLDKDGKTIKTYEGTSFIKTPKL